jgi:hypothetical protein
MSSDSEDAIEPSSLFKEPDDFYPPEKAATFAEHKLLSGQVLNLRLVGHNPLWVRRPPTSDGIRLLDELTSKSGPSTMERLPSNGQLPRGARRHTSQR